MEICIFCSSNQVNEKYIEPAKALARSLANLGHDLIYGGSDYGLMKIIADEMQSGGSKITGITIPIYSKYARKNVDEMIIAKTLGERKAQILERCDAIIILVGGIGTLDELTEALELKRQKYRDKPIIVLNTDRFYDGIKIQLNRIADERLLKAGENSHVPTPDFNNLINFVDTPQQVMQIINSLK